MIWGEAMFFCNKLDFLMNITKTTNSALSLYTSLDASYISRLRRGERGLPKNENYVKAMATYFSRNCFDNYQRKALLDVMDNASHLPDDCLELANLIWIWLLKDKTSESNSVKFFLNSISNSENKKPRIPESNSGDILKPKVEGTSIYYGVEGKREAVVSFLSMVISQDIKQTLLLSSDEDMRWLTDDPSYTAKWAKLMFMVIKKGNRIKIIHTVSRVLDEMLSAISGWMPLYMTGAIDPYYYPKKRDGIYKRTMFIAPEISAVISTSIGNMEDKESTFIITDNQAIESIAIEYMNYFSLCKPLMKVFSASNHKDYLETLHRFESEEAEAIIKVETLSLLTMPINIIEGILARSENKNKSLIINNFAIRKQTFENNLTKQNFSEIIRIPSISEIKEGSVKITFSDFFSSEQLYYTTEEFRLHLENIVSMLKNSQRYNVHLVKDTKEDGYMLYAKEDIGVIVARTSVPTAMIVIDESNMSAAFWDYLKDYNSNKQDTINMIQSVIDKLK